MQTEEAAVAGAENTAAAAAVDVRLAGVTKRFGDVTAVDNVDLEIRRGEFFALLGPSGSGKTTCLRMIAGFERPDEGRVELAGEDVTGLPPFERDVNTVFQDYALFPHMTVGENVAYGLRVQRVRQGGARANASARRWRWSAWRASRTAGPASSRAASASGWRSPAR